jgi:hypothetical protein
MATSALLMRAVCSSETSAKPHLTKLYLLTFTNIIIIKTPLCISDNFNAAIKIRRGGVTYNSRTFTSVPALMQLIIRQECRLDVSAKLVTRSVDTTPHSSLFRFYTSDVILPTSRSKANNPLYPHVSGRRYRDQETSAAKNREHIKNRRKS